MLHVINKMDNGGATLPINIMQVSKLNRLYVFQKVFLLLKFGSSFESSLSFDQFALSQIFILL